MKHYFLIATLVLLSNFLVMGELVRVVRDAEALPAENPPPKKALTSPNSILVRDDIEVNAATRKKYNLAEDVSEDYPAVFNIILFISISLILALIAICVTIATMDPGRDSLIYRVTSAQRYKKDN